MAHIESMAAFPDDRLTGSTSLSGDTLPSSEALLREVLAQSLPFDHPDWPGLVERAKAGDVQARHTLILSSLSYASPLAGRCAQLASHTEFLEFYQVATLVMLEQMDTAFATTEHPDKYLYGVARRAMLNHLDGRDPLITTPTGEYPYRCDSLDRTICAEGDSPTFADLLPAPSCTSLAEAEPPSDLKLTVASLFSQLDKPYQQVLNLRYGLSQEDGRELSAQEIAQRLDLPTHRVEQLLHYALILLRRRYFRAQRQAVASEQVTEYYRCGEVMRLLGVTRSALDGWVCSGKLTRYWLPGSRRVGVYAKADIDRLLQERRGLEEFYTTREAVAKVGLSEKRFRLAIKHGHVTRYRLSTSTRTSVYAKVDIDRLAEERRTRTRVGDARLARRPVAYA
jgi:RNA polymerase sigma factor (sigma-70 family)